MSRPFYNYFGPIFKRVGQIVYFLNQQGTIKSVDLSSPNSGFSTCVKDCRCFDVDANGIVCVDGGKKKISHYSSHTQKSTQS